MKQNIEVQKRVVARIKKEFEPLKKKESEARRLWTLGYKKFLTAHKKITERINKRLTVDPIDKKGVVNKTVQGFWQIMENWDERSIELTKRRDDARLAMESKKFEILREEEELRNLLVEYQRQLSQVDDMIQKVFMLNEGVVSALEHMDKYLATDVFPQLHPKVTRKLIENSTSTKKIVIMTNTINDMDVPKVEEATALINEFFDRINPKKEIESQDETITMLADLLKELLVVKTKFKAGPNLSKFLALELSEKTFPELKKAQKLLASATNYVRSGKYIRLSIRETKDDTWQPVRQS